MDADKLSGPSAPSVQELPVFGNDGAYLPPGDPVKPAVEGPRATTPAPMRKPGNRRRIVEWVVVVVFAVLVAGALRSFVVQAFFVPSGSMLPTLQLGDRIVVIKLGYTIHHGDIVVFKRPPADTGTTDKDLVKRVIGLPGETISSHGNTVLINGRPLAEPWLPRLTGSAPRVPRHPPHEDPARRLLRDGRLPW